MSCPASIEFASGSRAASANGNERPITVYMMDLLSVVPYYTGHLSSALLRRPALALHVGTITYHLDPAYFASTGITPAPGTLNITHRLRGWAFVRRATKTVEYVINLLTLAFRLWWARPDVLHVQFLPLLQLYISAELWFLRWVRWLNIPIVYTVHNVLPHDTGARLRESYARLYGLCDALVCHNHPSKDRLEKDFGVQSSKLAVIAHGPLFEQDGVYSRSAARQRLGIPDQGHLVLWQGILRPYKGVPFLLRAWKAVSTVVPNARLAIVGGGSADQNESIAGLVRSLGLTSTVQLSLRFVSREEVALHHAAADILVYPYSAATTSGALMTGLSYGRPIIATRLPAFESVLRDGENAKLVPFGDEQAFAAALLELLANDDERSRLGENGAATYRAAPQWADIAAQTENVYRSLINHAG